MADLSCSISTMDRIEAAIAKLTVAQDATVAKLDEILQKLALLENRCQFSKVSRLLRPPHLRNPLLARLLS